MKNDRFVSYLRIQLKRTAVYLPFVLLISALILGTMFTIFTAASQSHMDDPGKQKVQIGIVGNTDNAYLNIIFRTLRTLDSSRYSLDFKFLDEDEANAELEAQRITSYLVIPDGYVEAIEKGEYPPLQVVCNSNTTGFGAAITREIVMSISDITTVSISTLDSGYSFVRENLSDVSASGVYDKMVVRYIDVLLSRTQLYETKEVGVSFGQGFESYYMCALSVLFMMIWGVTAAPMFSRRNRELKKMLSADGFGTAGQISAEFMAYMLLMAFGMICAYVTALLAVKLVSPIIWERIGMELSDIFAFAAKALFPMLVFGAWNFMLFEAVNSTVSAILIQSLSAIVMGYASGAFYPPTMLPSQIRAFGQFLPSGVSIRFLSQPSVPDFMFLVLYAVLFGAVIFFVDKNRSEEGGI